ncbi:tripartite tricarboxylate transporter TctB family protein [Microvirga zambiensis]|uniref:tripartite tricarboxylate transporter TctB family protein n=1 Tax=Microvirga zambiensis TaxID=1402137 RepID=UPI001FE6E17D|nr:tripartite tricarboxylate transporter TctB family protein [Microvirga zambiensis]
MSNAQPVPMSRVQPRTHIDVAGVVIALLLLVLAGMVWWDMTKLQILSPYDLGPKVMPIVVAIGLTLLALGNGVGALQGNLPARDSLDWKPIILILGGLAALIVLIAIGGGFMIGTAILFATTSAAFGRRAFLTDLLIGAVISVFVYLLFGKLLTLSLPAGPLEHLL